MCFYNAAKVLKIIYATKIFAKKGYFSLFVITHKKRRGQKKNMIFYTDSYGIANLFLYFCRRKPKSIEI